MYKLIKDNLKEISIAILIMGLVRQILYYGRYGLPIKYFLGISELWLIISDDLIVAGPFLVVLIYAGQKALINYKEKKISDRTIFIIITSILSSLSIYLIFIGDSYIEFWNFIFMASLIVLFFLFFIIPSLVKSFGVYLFILLILWKGLVDINNIDHGRFLNTRIISDKKEYISVDSFYFIGKTSEYVFFFDKNKNSTTVIPVRLVTEMEIQSNYGK